MNIIKLGILSLFFLFLATLGISLLIPSRIRISKAINLHAEKDAVFALIVDRQKWKLWHPAFMPSEERKNFSNINSTLEIANDSVVRMQLVQGDKPPVVNGWQIYRACRDSITLQWYMDFHQGWLPWQKFGSLFYENTYGVLMEQGLINIKKMVQVP